MNKSFLLVCALVFGHFTHASDLSHDEHLNTRQITRIASRIMLEQGFEKFNRQAIAEDEYTEWTDVVLLFRVAQKKNQANQGAKTPRNPDVQDDRKVPTVCFVGTLRPPKK